MNAPITSTVPQIRFKGFEGAWGNEMIGSLCGEFHSGKFISASDIAEIGEYPVYGGNGLRGFAAKYNHEGLYALIGRQGALCGNMNLFSGKAFFTEHAVAVQANMSNDTFFLYYLFGRMNLGQYSSQSAQPGLAVNKLQNLSSLVCTKNEQTKIGSYFREVDRLIGLHQRKHDKLVALKKAMLQKMFPQPGATTPEIRFKGFSGDWEQLPLRKIASKVLEKNILKKYTETLTNSAEYGVISQLDYFDKEISNVENIGGYYIVAPDSFVYNPRISEFAPCGPVNRNNLGRTGIMSPLYTVLRTKSMDNTFLEYFFKTNLWHPFMFLNGDTGARADRFSIKDIVFMELLVPYPILEEQQKIGSYFRTLDELLAKHAAQLQKLRQLKSACLGKMFV